MRWMLLLLVLSIPFVAMAVPSGLNLMPTAEVLSLAQSRYDFESTGTGKLFVPDGSTVIGSQFGSLMGIEAGADQVSGVGLVYNGKWLFSREGKLMPAIAAGAQNVIAGRKPQYYLVATKTLLPSAMLKVHGGVIRHEGDYRAMIGASSKISVFTLKADRVQGDDYQATAFGIGLTTRGFTVSTTRYVYDDERGDETTFGVSYMMQPMR